MLSALSAYYSRIMYSVILVILSIILYIHGFGGTFLVP